MREPNFGLPFRDYPERACAGPSLADQIDEAYAEAHRRHVLRYLSERDVERGFTREQALKAFGLTACIFVALVVLLIVAVRA